MPTDVGVATMTPVMATVEVAHREVADTVTLGLRLPTASMMPQPGQFAMLWVPGVGEAPISYSRIGPDRWVEHTIRAVGPVTRALTAIDAGHIVGIRGPLGSGWDLTGLGGRDLVIVAGGLGMAPLRPVVDAAAAGGVDAESARLLVGARRPEAVLYAEEIADRWHGLAPAVTVDAAATAWSGAVGPVTRLLEGAALRPARTSVLVCGPEVMMRVVCSELVTAGVLPDAIQVSIERNMDCGIGQCGHCQLGPLVTCIDGPVVTWATAGPLLRTRER